MDIGVIGGGPAGMAAAISAVRASGGLASVTVFERNQKCGKKLLMTGNGRCNIMNASFEKEAYISTDAGIFSDYIDIWTGGEPDRTVIEFLNSIGIMLTAEEDRFYPRSMQASSVFSALNEACRECGVEIVTDKLITRVERGREKPWSMGGRDFNRIIAACGGRSYGRTGSDGIGFELLKLLGVEIRPTYPVLVPLVCEGKVWKSLAGVRNESVVRLFQGGRCVREEAGELQLTEYGVSGYPVFQLSLHIGDLSAGAERAELEIDLMPEYTGQELAEDIKIRCEAFPGYRILDGLNSILNIKLLSTLVKQAGVSYDTTMGELKSGDIEKICSLIKGFRVRVRETRGFDMAQATGGGVSLAGVNDRLELRDKKGLFVAGEMLDVTGRCGGFNLEWAFLSGIIAGRAAGNMKNS